MHAQAHTHIARKNVTNACCHKTCIVFKRHVFLFLFLFQFTLLAAATASKTQCKTKNSSSHQCLSFNFCLIQFDFLSLSSLNGFEMMLGASLSPSIDRSADSSTLQQTLSMSQFSAIEKDNHRGHSKCFYLPMI